MRSETVSLRSVHGNHIRFVTPTQAVRMCELGEAYTSCLKCGRTDPSSKCRDGMRFVGYEHQFVVKLFDLERLKRQDPCSITNSEMEAFALGQILSGIPRSAMNRLEAKVNAFGTGLA